MKTLTNIIGGSEVPGESNFTVRGPFPEYPIEVQLPGFDSRHATEILRQLSSRPALSLEKRREIIGSLRDYTPSQETLESMTKITGMPISWVAARIQEGKELALKISGLNSRQGDYSAVVSMTPNDPREIFFFLAHFLTSGTPAAIKLSSREPFLGREVVKYLLGNGMPDGLVSIFYTNTSDSMQTKTFADMLATGRAQCHTIPIVMGAATLAPGQISFYAEHARGLVMDADRARPHLRASVQSPLSCVAEHLYVAVGRRNYMAMIDGLREEYAALMDGDLLDPKTTLGRIQPSVLDAITGDIKLGIYTGTMALAHPDTGIREAVERGAVIAARTHPNARLPNPAFTNPWPAYLTFISYAETTGEAVKILETASRHLSNGRSKSIAVGVYGNTDCPPNLQAVAFDIYVNRSPVNVDGLVHQGIKLNEVLTR